jgi:1-acyl-sn-glycerol-3-phosphate acyltransferase
MNPLIPVAMVVQRLLVDIPCRIDDTDFKQVPARGPLIAVANHINAIEIPIFLSHLYPRPLSGMAKSDAWQNPFFRLLYSVYGIVPVRRGEGDMTALKMCVERLAEGNILSVAPEGTRSRTGQMAQGKPGVVLLAVKSGAPILPISHYGGENLWKNLRRLKRTPIKLKVGSPFTIDLHNERLSKEVSLQITDEIMWQLAALLPPYYRGYYSNLDKATEQYLKFEPGVPSNLNFASQLDAITPPVA